MKDVLVLNANFQPINVCTIRRAVGLMLLEKATMIMDGRGEIHSANRSFPYPSIIRLQHMIQRPRPHISLSRKEILRRDNYTCQYCGKRSLDLTIDHVIPHIQGGTHTWNNVVAACPACNHRKGSLTVSESHMQLLRAPKEPPLSARYIFGRYIPDNSDWEPYLTGW